MTLTVALLALVVLVVFLWWNRSARHLRAVQRAFGRGDEVGALDAFARAEASGRLDANATASYVYLALKHGRNDEAGELLDRAFAHGRKGKPLDVAGRRLLETYKAMLLWKLDRLDESVDLLEALLESGYRTTAVYGNLGYLLQVKGDFARAEAVCREAHDWDPDGKVILDNLGVLLVHLNQWDEAREVYTRLLNLTPKFPEAWYGAGLVAHHDGDLETARQHWTRALELPFHALTTIDRAVVEKAFSELPPAPV